MSDAPAVGLQAEEMPLPLGVQAESGQLMPALTPEDLKRIGEAPAAVAERGQAENTAFLAVSSIDPNNLAEAGWGIILPEGLDPKIREALAPLIEQRRRQVGDAKLFRIFEGKAGYRRGDTVRAWLDRFNVGLATVDPELGVPLYLLLVGGPDLIPFEFQYLLDAYWCVGRVAFDRVEEYRSYAEGVVRYEEAATIGHKRQVAVFNTRNIGDRATAMLHDQVATPLAGGGATQRPLGQRQGFALTPLLADAATKENLGKTLTANQAALLFTGSHGVGFSVADARQRAMQGAILCQDWEGGPVGDAEMFSAGDIDGNARLDGLIHFFFACYGGGAPAFDTYSRQPDGNPLRICPEAMVARLPQVMLARGAQAVLAHIDRAWSYSFQAGRGAPQTQEFRDVMTRLLRGERIGQSTDQFNLRWAVLSAELADLQQQRELLAGQVPDAVVANRWVARDDARNYVILGDPAVRLRVEKMA